IYLNRKLLFGELKWVKRLIRLQSFSKIPPKNADFRAIRRITALYDRTGRPPAGLPQRRGERQPEGFLLARSEDARDGQPSPMRDREQALDPEFLVGLAVEPDPYRVESPFGDLPAMTDLAHAQLARRHRHRLIGGCGPVIGPERQVDEQHIEPEKADDWPGADPVEHEPGREA